MNVVFTPLALAERWGATVPQIEAMLRRGELRGFKIGRYWRITEAAVLEHENGEGSAA